MGKVCKWEIRWNVLEDVDIQELHHKQKLITQCLIGQGTIVYHAQQRKANVNITWFCKINISNTFFSPTSPHNHTFFMIVVTAHKLKFMVRQANTLGLDKTVGTINVSASGGKLIPCKKDRCTTHPHPNFYSLVWLGWVKSSTW